MKVLFYFFAIKPRAFCSIEIPKELQVEGSSESLLFV